MLGFIAGKFDMMTLPPTLLKDVKIQAPEAICDRVPDNAARSLILNRAAPPFDNPDLRRAMALSLDRKAFIDILGEGQGAIGGAMLPPPEGVWGMPPEILSTLRGYDPDVPKNRAEARRIMQKLGFGPDKRLAVTVSTRNVPVYRDPAVILIDQLKEVYIDGVLETVPTVNWYPKVARKDYRVGLSISENSLDEPDQSFYENYVCGAEHNYTGYCNPEIDKLIDEQSMVSDQEKRQRLVWDIERKLAEDGAQPIIFYGHYGICWRPQLKGLTLMVNSLFNGWRMEDVWLDK
jgi:peptide/nickel transport system substrate-binding protein